MRSPSPVAASRVPGAGVLARRAGAALPDSVRRRIPAAVASALLLSSGYLFWLRDLPVFAVSEVTVTGLTTSDTRIRAALERAARDMTTLHVRRDRLEEAVADFTVVRYVEAVPDFPRGLRIQVTERRPAAVILGRGRTRLPVGADGTILRGLPLDRPLPALRAPATASGDRLDDRRALGWLRLIGAAPRPLERRVEEVRERRGTGVVVELRRGPDLLFGDLSLIDLKWAAAARVLADASARGATYIDVRMPDRPAAGGVGVEAVDAAATPPGATSPSATGGLAPGPPGAGAAIGATGAAGLQPGAPPATAPAPGLIPGAPAPVPGAAGAPPAAPAAPVPLP